MRCPICNEYAVECRVYPCHNPSGTEDIRANWECPSLHHWATLGSDTNRVFLQMGTMLVGPELPEVLRETFFPSTARSTKPWAEWQQAAADAIEEHQRRKQ
jgi:hypothetical protein